MSVQEEQKTDRRCILDLDLFLWFRHDEPVGWETVGLENAIFSPIFSGPRLFNI
jgi:hypothetical protein